MHNYNWDLTKMFKSEKEFNKTIDEVNSLCNKVVSLKGKILSSSDTLLEVLEMDNRMELLIERLYVYSFLSYYENMSNVKSQEYKEKVLALLNDVSSKTSFITPELLLSNYDKILNYIKENKKLEKYTIMLERIFRYKPHVLSENEEKILSDMSDIMRISKSTFEELNNVDSDFGKIKNEKGQSVVLTNANYGKFLSSKNLRVRKDAFDKEYKFYKNHINTISSLYIGKVKTNCALSHIRNYNSALEMSLFSDNIDSKLYSTLIKITDNNIKYLKDFYDLKSKQLGSKLHMYDLYVNTSIHKEKHITYEDAIKLINKALMPLGKDYLDSFNHLINNRCVDVYPKDKKRSGAYEWGAYGCEPYVSLNFESTIDSVSTLAHEMGHAMHTYYSNKNQDFLYASYPIFLAEIASTVNEILLSEYLYNNTNDKDEKEYYLIEFLDKFKATVYRQVMFAEFESIIHKKYESGIALTKDLLCSIYYDLNKKHFDGSVIVDKTIEYEWARIPHFYDSFYVYKYATGFISALLIADRLLNTNDFKDKYIKFLSSGDIMYPLDLLKSIDIDLTDEKTLERAFSIFNEKLMELKKLEGCEINGK